MSYDGATLRRLRLQDILSFIKDHPDNAPTLAVTSLMVLKHGLKMKTTETMLHELAQTGVIRYRGNSWVITRGKEIGDFIEQDKTRERNYVK